MNLDNAFKDLIGTALQDHLEVAIDVWNGRLNVEIYFDGEMVADGDMDVTNLPDEMGLND